MRRFHDRTIRFLRPACSRYFDLRCPPIISCLLGMARQFTTRAAMHAPTNKIARAPPPLAGSDILGDTADIHEGHRRHRPPAPAAPRAAASYWASPCFVFLARRARFRGKISLFRHDTACAPRPRFPDDGARTAVLIAAQYARYHHAPPRASPHDFARRCATRDMRICAISAIL